MISYNGCPLQWVVFCGMAIQIVLNYPFACKLTKCAFRNEGGENPLAIVNVTEASDYAANKPMRDMGVLVVS